jgi:hypothetical protein
MTLNEPPLIAPDEAFEPDRDRSMTVLEFVVAAIALIAAAVLAVAPR